MTAHADALRQAPPHGGPDGGTPIRIDFSTNAHPLGPTPSVQAAVHAADRTRYPDPGHAGLIDALARFHGVAPSRLVVGGSASELIWRISRCWAQAVGGPVVADAAGVGCFGEYRRAALGCGLQMTAAVDARAVDATGRVAVGETAGGRAVETAGVTAAGTAGVTAGVTAAETAGVAAATPTAAEQRVDPAPSLHWCCSPANPGGTRCDDAVCDALDSGNPRSLVMVDLAYRPFLGLLDGAAEPSRLTQPWADAVVQLWSPNKLHGLTGVRGAYLLLPAAPHAAIDAAALDALAPAWVLGADGAALLHAHLQPAALAHLRRVQPTLVEWTRRQHAALAAADWQLEPSALHFGLARPPVPAERQPDWHAALRRYGIKLRDAASFGRPGWVRLRAAAPADVAELLSLTAGWREA